MEADAIMAQVEVYTCMSRSSKECLRLRDTLESTLNNNNNNNNPTQFNLTEPGLN